jgi:hypothetical protein
MEGRVGCCGEVGRRWGRVSRHGEGDGECEVRCRMRSAIERWVGEQLTTCLLVQSCLFWERVHTR